MDLQKLSLKELREEAKKRGLSGISGLRKADLIQELERHISSGSSAEKETAPSPKRERTSSPAGKDASTGKRAAVGRRTTVGRRTEAAGKIEVANSESTAEKRGTAERGAGDKRASSGREKQANTYMPNHGSSGNRSYSRNNAGTGERGAFTRQHDTRQQYDARQQHDTRHEYRQETEARPYRTIEEVVKAGLITIAKDRQVSDVHPTEIKELDSGITKKGILEIMPEGYGFIRCDNFLPGENDVYVSHAFLRRFGLRTGDIVEGNIRVKTQNEKFSALLYMKSVNERPITYLAHREKFEDLTPIFPNERIHLETADSGVSMRMMDLIAPIGKGQRGMIVSQPKTGKTTLLKQVARAITKNYPKMHLLILLIDERPEEVTDIKESIEGERVEVIYSTFDELPENHKRVSEMVIERAKRLVEGGDDVVILLDSITRLARAYNLTVTPSGRTLSGGLDPAALHMPKRFFGAARNMREGGSLTILATALVDTGSRMDDVVFEEFKGTGNMELVLDRHLSEKRVFPAIDIQRSSTRREDLLMSQSELEAVFLMRRALSGNFNTENNLEQIINLFRRTKNNREFIETIKKIKLH